MDLTDRSVELSRLSRVTTIWSFARTDPPSAQLDRSLGAAIASPFEG
jgi:hypothetical protein